MYTQRETFKLPRTGRISPEGIALLKWMFDFALKHAGTRVYNFIDLNDVLVRYGFSNRSQALFLLKELVAEGYLKEHAAGFQNPFYTLTPLAKELLR